MTWNAGLGHGHPRMRAGAGRGGGARPAGDAQRRPSPPRLRAGELLAEVTPRRSREDVSSVFRAPRPTRTRSRSRASSPGGRRSSRARAAITAPRWRCCRCRAIRGASRSSPACRASCAWRDPYCYRCPFGKEPTSCAHECAEDLETVLLREGAGHRRGRDPGRDRRRQRRVRAAARLLAEDSRHLRSPRRPADRRRGAVGVRPHRALVRRRPRRRHARPDDDGQGTDGRLRAGRRRRSSPIGSPGTSTTTCWCAG